MNTNRQDARGFTLIELLVVISIIALLVSILMPSLMGAKEQAKATQCLANLRNLGTAMVLYHAENDGSFWPYCGNAPTPRTREWYFWGNVRADGSVDPTPSPFMAYIGNNVNFLACPSQPFGSYVPQSGAEEQTTNYGYNAYFLSPPGAGRVPPPPRPITKVPEPAKLFVFNDSAMYWDPEGVYILQNSAYLEPVFPGGTFMQQPTSHFRHTDRTNALLADGHADRFGLEGGTKLDRTNKLSFVGTENYPHYAQP